MSKLKAPFPWFGGKSRAAHLVWERFGDVHHYIEPFFGSGAVLLGRPEHHKRSLSTVNDIDGFVANFWRAVKYAPDEVAIHADWPVNEVDLHARDAHLLSLRESFTFRLKGDPKYFDAEIAGWWAWGVSTSIGTFAQGLGPWRPVDGVFTKVGVPGTKAAKPRVSDRGLGIHRSGSLFDLMGALSRRLRAVRVLSGDWGRCVSSKRVLHPTGSTAGVFLDPPYLTDFDPEIYGGKSAPLGVQEWCIKHGGSPSLRIALCGYEGEYNLPGWTVVEWKATGGHRSRTGTSKATLERIWFSPHCLKPEALL